MKTQISVDSTAGGIELVPAGNWKFICFQVQGANTIYVDFVRDDADAVALTTSNGVAFAATDGAQLIANGLPVSIAKNGIKAICAAAETSNVVVQYY